VGVVIGTSCRVKCFRCHIFPGVAKEWDKCLPFFVFDFRIFERCEEELVPFVVLVFAGSILLGHYRGNQGLKLGDVGVDRIRSKFAHKHELSFKAKFVFTSGGPVLFLEGRKDFRSGFAVFHCKGLALTT